MKKKKKQNFKNYISRLCWYKDKSIHVIYENMLRFLFIPSSFKIKPSFFVNFLGVWVLSIVSTVQWIN